MDIKPQPYYPYEFHRWDALTFPLKGFDAIHASPPCQRFSIASLAHPGTRDRYPDLIGPIRARLESSGVPWIIENVEGAPLIDPVMLCGTMFGLHIRRHRLFETSFPVPASGQCDHSLPVLNPYKKESRKRFRDEHGIDMRSGPWQEAMGVPWMKQAQATEAVPPAYTGHIGGHLMSLLTEEAEVA